MIAEMVDILSRIANTCRQHGVTRLWLYGSATGQSQRAFKEGSDLDLLVEFAAADQLPGGWSHPLFTLPELLESIAGRPVHVTENVEFANPYFREEVLRTRES